MLADSICLLASGVSKPIDLNTHQHPDPMTPVLPNSFCLCSFHMPDAPKLALLGRVLGLVVVFAGFEFIVGHMSHSLSLQADSGHMLSDGVALAIALLAAWMARRSSVRKQSAIVSLQLEIWAALVNGLGLFGMAGLIAWEAYSHWQAPPTEILSVPMFVTAILGLVINGISLQWLQSFQKGERLDNPRDADLNVQGALLHVLADVMGSVGVIIAAIAVWMWGWTWADDVISLGLALLIGGSAIPLIQKSLQQLWASKPSSLIDRSPSFPLASSVSRGGNLKADLHGLGFYEIGQTNLHQMIGGAPSLDSPILGPQPSGPQDAHNQPQSDKASSDK